MNKKNNPLKKGLRELTYEEVVKLNELIESIPMSELPRIWYELNHHQWSKELGEPPTSFIDDDYLCAELHFIMMAIELECGKKAVLRYFHIVEMGKTNEQFEDWWDSHCLRVIEKKQTNYQPISHDYSTTALIISIIALLGSLAKLFLA